MHLLLYYAGGGYCQYKFPFFGCVFVLDLYRICTILFAAPQNVPSKKSQGPLTPAAPEGSVGNGFIRSVWGGIVLFESPSEAKKHPTTNAVCYDPN